MRIGFVSNVKVLAGAAGLLLALVLIVGMVVAARSAVDPPSTHQFWGNVTVNGAQAPEGTAVSARIGGVEYGSGTVDAAGRYGDVPNFFVTAPASLAGQTISFYVAGVLAPETAVYQVLGYNALNLSVTTVTPTPTPTPTFPAWDINMDGCINVLDLIMVGQHFGETGAPGWIREDVNHDGVINVLDLIIIGQHFGEGCGG